MARKKKVEEKNYDELIKASEEHIATLMADLKEERVNLKKLKKDKVVYDQMIEDQKKENEIREISALIAESGKTLDEIKKLLIK